MLWDRLMYYVWMSVYYLLKDTPEEQPAAFVLLLLLLLFIPFLTALDPMYFILLSK